jgi:NAD(P)-dependent dehydrogenase (short-subunit alcohol dehydrogenase family)
MNTGQTIIVAGGAGAVGQGIVRALLDAGAKIHVPTRRPAELDRLASFVGADAFARLIAHDVDLGDALASRRFLDAVLVADGRLDGVVASLGGWLQGSELAAIASDEWATVVQNNLTSHIDAARLFIPALARQTTLPCYLMINGGAALQPVPLAGPMSIVSAAQAMIARVLASENGAKGVRVNQLILNSPIITHHRPQGRANWLTADEVGAVCAWLLSPQGRAISGAVWTLGEKSTPADSPETSS